MRLPRMLSSRAAKLMSWLGVRKASNPIANGPIRKVTVMDTKVTVYASNNGSQPDISVHISCAELTEIDESAEKRGLPGMREGLVEACKDTPEYRKYVILHEQIAAARQKIVECAEAERQAKAARVLLEKNPTGSFAEKLREAADEVKRR